MIPPVEIGAAELDDVEGIIEELELDEEQAGRRTSQVRTGHCSLCYSRLGRFPHDLFQTLASFPERGECDLRIDCNNFQRRHRKRIRCCLNHSIRSA